MSSTNLVDAVGRIPGVRTELHSLAQQRFDGALNEKVLRVRLRTMVWKVRQNFPEVAPDLLFLALQRMTRSRWEALVKDYIVRSPQGASAAALAADSELPIVRDEVVGERSYDLAMSLVKDVAMVRAGANYDELFPVAQSFLLGAWEVGRRRRYAPKND
jgi:hypothetical protein